MTVARRRRLLPIGAAVGVLLLTAVLQPRQIAGQDAASKLTTVLADLAGAVPQDGGTGEAPPPARPLDVTTLDKSVRDAIRGGRLRLNDRDEVQVYVLVTSVGEDVLAALGRMGARVEIADAARRRVQARVPASRLRQIAGLPFVRFVRLPNYAFRQRTGSATTEGDRILGADAARAQFGLDGAGVSVGVISDGIRGLLDRGCRVCGGADGGPIARGDLPETTGIRAYFGGPLHTSSGGVVGQSFHSDGDLEGLPPSGCAFSGAGAEGTALLEIVHDLAPGAQLAFANADTDLGFMRAVDALAASHDVVVDDLGFFGDAYDGTSGVSTNTAAALNNPANRIRAYVTSVGNSAAQHYFGAYVSSGVEGTAINRLSTPGKLHLFRQTMDTTDVLGLGDRPHNLIALARGGQAVIFLSWDDPSGESANNYDLYLVRDSNNTVVARSTDVQSGEEDPLEVLDFANDGNDDLFRVVVQNVRDRAEPRALNIFVLQPQCAPDGPRRLAIGRPERMNFNTATRSVSAQSDAGGSPVSVISVGAICSASAASAAAFPGNASCTDPTNRTLEFFSSRGPTLDGRMKPDLVAIDGVEITGAGAFPNPFFGTSASAPHVAGQAALLLQAAPCLRNGAAGAREPDAARARLREMILSTAQPLAAVPDNVFGFGRADVLASVQQTLPAHAGPAAVVVPGNSASGAAVRAADLGFSDPNACPALAVTATGGCANGKGATIACPFGTSQTRVTASTSGTAFSAPIDLQVTVTDFAVLVAGSPVTISAGESTLHDVTIASIGGPFAADVALSCAGLPPGASCSFGAGALAPGAGSVQTTVRIDTAGAATTTRGSAVGVVWILALIGGLVLFAVCVRSADLRRPGLPPPRKATADHRSLGGGGQPRLVPLLLLLAFSLSCEEIRQPPAPIASLSPASLDFGAQVTQTPSADRVVTLTNTGNAPLAVQSIATSGDFGQVHNCALSLAPGSACPIRVRFTPTANGPRAGALTVTTSAAGSPHLVPLTGSGAAPTAGTPPGTYVVSITGTSAHLAHSATVTLTVR